MKILVFAHRLEFGGTQVNGIDLAAAMRDIRKAKVEYVTDAAQKSRIGVITDLADAQELAYWLFRAVERTRTEEARQIDLLLTSWPRIEELVAAEEVVAEPQRLAFEEP